MSFGIAEGFEHVLISESYVLDLLAKPGRIEVTLDLALLEGHRAYAAPRPGERFCFASATLVFDGVTDLSWTGQGRRPAVDADGEVDYGTIELLSTVDGSWRLVGDWGELRIAARSMELRVHER